MLSREQRRRFLLLQAIYIVTAVLQAAGIASIAPFVALLSNRELIHNNEVLSFLFKLGGFSDDIAFMVAFAVIVMVVIAVSNAVLALSTWLTLLFSIRTGQEFQRAILINYLHQDYVQFSRRNSSELISEVTQESPRLVYNVLIPLLNMSGHGLVIILIVSGLFVLDWVIALSTLFVVGGGYVLVFGVIRTRLLRHGQNISRTNHARFKLLTESLGGVKEVKLFGVESLYEERIAKINADGLRSTAVIGLFGDIPKFVLETIAFCAILTLASILLMQRADASVIVGTLSLYAIAGYRLLPAAQMMFKSVSQIRANGEVVAALHPQVLGGRARIMPGRNPAPTGTAVSASERAISGDLKLAGVTYRYPGADVAAIQDVSLTIPQNRLIALVGCSGAGKSTLADILLGMLEPTEGSFHVGSLRIDRTTARAWQRNVGYVPQTIFILDDSVAANICFGLPDSDQDAIRSAARLANIDEFIESLPGTYEYVVGERGSTLSGGQRQRIGIARALYRKASVLIMDEATSALDSRTENEVMATIVSLKESKTIVMIAHRLSTIRSADLVVFMNEGTINDCGTFEELCKRNTLFRRHILATGPTEAE
jgi:HlyD family secretion protein